jgi:drug/metabolite transporter (DMT)-like permease
MSLTVYLQAFLAILLWSLLSYLGVRLAHVPPFLLTGVGLMIGSLCSVLNIAQWRVSVTTLLLGIYWLFGAHLFLFLALRHAPAVEANLINYLWPLLIVLLSPVFLNGYRLGWRHVAAGLLGFGGAALIVTGGKFALEMDHLAGYFFAGVAAFIMASAPLVSKRLKPYPDAATGFFCLVSGILALGVHFCSEPAYHFMQSDWLPLIVIGLGPMGAAFYFWNSAIKKGDPRILGALAYLIPLLSTVILIFAADRPLTLTTGVAMAMIIGGAIVGSELWH